MKHSEFKKNFNKLPDDNIFRDNVFTLEIPSEKFSATYDTIGLQKFIENQKSLWEEAPAHKKFRYSINFYSVLLNTIESVINESNRNPLDTHRNINRQLSSINNAVLLYDSPKTIFLKDILLKHPELFDGAFDALAETIQTNSGNNKSYFKGMLLATNFETQDLKTLSLLDTEQISFSQLRNKFEQDNFEGRQAFDKMLEESTKESQIHLGNLISLRDIWNEEFNKLYRGKEEEAEMLVQKAKSTASSLFRKSVRAKMNLEQKYREHMSFEVPAQHWKTRAKELNDEGHKFMTWLIVMVFTGALSLFALLWLTPADMLASIFSNEPVQAIRWSIIFITFISFLFFGIQALKKAMFSSFHLARDAEERERLTLFYLSLIKDATISQEDRNLVLQSLFSRSDTGMLKDEGSPTMPGIFEKFK